MSTTIRPTGSAIGSPAPIAAASDSSIRCTSRAPADSDASSTARRSTSVTPDGAHMTSRGRLKRLESTFSMKRRSIASVTSKSAITPWRSGRSAEMLAGVRPIISCASEPTACTSPVRSSIATTDGSDSTMPAPAHVDHRVRGPEVDAPCRRRAAARTGTRAAGRSVCRGVTPPPWHIRARATPARLQNEA